MSIALTDDEKAWLRKKGPGTGTHYFDMCGMCGQPTWRMTDGNKPDDVIASIGQTACSRCQEVHNRAPEVFDWVISVLNWKDRVQSKNPSST